MYSSCALEDLETLRPWLCLYSSIYSFTFPANPKMIKFLKNTNQSLASCKRHSDIGFCGNSVSFSWVPPHRQICIYSKQFLHCLMNATKLKNSEKLVTRSIHLNFTYFSYQSFLELQESIFTPRNVQFQSICHLHKSGDREERKTAAECR